MKHRAPDDRSGTAEDPPSDQQGFLQRWSRLKDAAREQPDETPAPAEQQAELPAANEQAPAEPVLTDADMPALETLGPDSDFSPFMSPGVSEKLRKLALRKLFQLPQFNIRDGLDDYDEDFTVFEPLGDTVTADMKHRQERREARERAEREAELARAEADEAANEDQRLPEQTTGSPDEHADETPPPEGVEQQRAADAGDTPADDETKS